MLMKHRLVFPKIGLDPTAPPKVIVEPFNDTLSNLSLRDDVARGRNENTEFG